MDDAEPERIDPEDLETALRIVRRVPPDERRQWLESLPPVPGVTEDQRQEFFTEILRQAAQPEN